MIDKRLLEMARLKELLRYDEHSGARTIEECAKVCSSLPAPPSCYQIERSMWYVATVECADAIRALGERT